MRSQDLKRLTDMVELDRLWNQANPSLMKVEAARAQALALSGVNDSLVTASEDYERLRRQMDFSSLIEAQLAAEQAFRPFRDISGLASREIAAATAGLAAFQDQHAAIFDQLRDATRQVELAFPRMDQLASLAATAAAFRELQPAEDIGRISQVLADQMSRMDHAWMAIQLPDLSAMAFGQVSYRASLLLEAAPFTHEGMVAAETLFGRPLEVSIWEETEEAPEARDEYRADVGAEPALLAIPDEARLSVGTAVGLIIPVPRIPRVLTLHRENGVNFSPISDEWLRAAEVTLRFFVVTALKRLHGPEWLNQGLPPGMAARWSENQDKQTNAGRPMFEVFHYSDLGDWLQIISRNWKTAFEPVFGKKEYLTTFFDHIIPLRNENGHHRPSNEMDQLAAITFAMQLVERIDRHVKAEGWPPLGD
jgi:hypothetical protein